MIFNEHSDLKGQHALFSPSSSAWLRYDSEKVADRILSQYRAPLGTEIHEYAAIQIELGQKVSSVKHLKQSISSAIYIKYLNMDREHESYIPYAMKLIKFLGFLQEEIFETVKQYINDAIGYKMTAEQVICYSDEIFGTTDAVAFRNNFLRIHDLKTGAFPAHMEQLEVYAALFCMEYKIKPGDIGMELRLYQTGDIIVHNPTAEDILPIMDQIVTIGRTAKEIKELEG